MYKNLLYSNLHKHPYMLFAQAHTNSSLCFMCQLVCTLMCKRTVGRTLRYRPYIRMYKIQVFILRFSVQTHQIVYCEASVQLTAKFTEALMLFCVPRHISQITLVVFLCAQGMDEYQSARILKCTYKYLHIQQCVSSNACE